MAWQTTHAPTVRINAPSCACASHTKPDFGTGEEQVKRALERRLAAVAVHRGGRAVVLVLAQECAKHCLGILASGRGHRSAPQGDRRNHADPIGVSLPSSVAQLTITNGSSAARMAAGTATGRCVARSTHTCTKCPVAAGASSPLRNSAIS